MNTRYLLLLLLLLIAACKKKVERIVTYECTTPTIILYNQEYSNSEWDTIVTRVYNPGFQQPVILDTFLPLINTQNLQISHDESNPKDYEIYLLSVNKTYRVYDIEVHKKTRDLPEGTAPNCFHDIEFGLDDKRINNLDVSSGKVFVELKK